MIITCDKIKAKIYYKYKNKTLSNIKCIFLSVTFVIFSVFRRSQPYPGPKKRKADTDPKKWWYCNNKRWREYVSPVNIRNNLMQEIMKNNWWSGACDNGVSRMACQTPKDRRRKETPVKLLKGQ